MSSRRPTWARLTIAVVAVVLVAAVLWLVPSREWIGMAVSAIRGLGPWGVVAFAGIYALLTTTAIPNTPLTIGAGLFFGLLLGFTAALVGTTLAAVLSFLLARYLLRDMAQRVIERYPNCEAVFDAVEEEGFKVVLLVRANPMIPASVKNYGIGLTDIPFYKYASATVLGSTPLLFVYAYLGSAGHDIFSAERELTTLDYTLIGAGLLLSIALGVMVTLYAKKRMSGYSPKKKTS